LYEYNAIIENIVDGDTFDVNIDLGFDIWHKIRVRLLDVDTPECRINHGEDEKIYGEICKSIANRLFLGEKCVIKSVKDSKARTDSFGRYLVYCEVDGENIVDTYNNLGINKKHENYSRDNVFKAGKEFDIVGGLL